MRAPVAAGLLLAGCTLDARDVLDGAELQVTVQGIAPAAREVAVTVADDDADLAGFRPEVSAPVLDVWFRELPPGASRLEVRSLDGGRVLQCRVEAIDGAGEPRRRIVVNLSSAPADCTAAGPAPAHDGPDASGVGGAPDADDPPEADDGGPPDRGAGGEGRGRSNGGGRDKDDRPKDPEVPASEGNGPENPPASP